MIARDAFKAGFMQACGEMGLSGPQVAELTKKAALLLEKRAFGEDLTNNLTGIAGGLALGLPAVAGMGAGYLAHKVTKNDVDPEDVKKQELIQELRMYARRAKENQQTRQLR